MGGAQGTISTMALHTLCPEPPSTAWAQGCSGIGCAEAAAGLLAVTAHQAWVQQQNLVFRVEGSPIPMTGPTGKPRPADQKARSVDSPHRPTKKGREQGEPEGREVMEEGLRLECRRWNRKE